MSKFQVKVSFKDLSKYINDDIYLHFVLKNGIVNRAQFLKLDKDKLHIKNALGHKTIITIKAIAEIWTEKEVVTP